MLSMDTNYAGALRDDYREATECGDYVTADELLRMFGHEVERLTDLLIAGTLAPALPVVVMS